MRYATKNGKLTEVLVGRDDHTPLGMGEPENLCVTGIATPIGSSDDIMPSGAKIMCRAAPDTRVQQHPHLSGASDCSNSILSCATIRCA